jgi:hypothetical protein
MRALKPFPLLAVALLAGAPVLAAPLPAAEDAGAVLKRQTQEMLDAVTAGDPKVWDRYLDPGMVYTDESGVTKTKAELLPELEPLPKEIWGKLTVSDFAVRRHGDTAVATYTSDEQEGYFGQVIAARYRETDTWKLGKDGWRLIAAQVLALRQDPPATALPAAKLDDYVGTYALTPTVSYTLKKDGDGLVGQRTGRQPEKLQAEVADLFFVAGQPRLRKVFQRGPDGQVTGFVERRETWDIAWKRQP